MNDFELVAGSQQAAYVNGNNHPFDTTDARQLSRESVESAYAKFQAMEAPHESNTGLLDKALSSHNHWTY